MAKTVPQVERASTYGAFATSEADTMVGGRFAVVDQNKIAVGATARPDYPPAAPHQTDPTGPEPLISFPGVPEPTGEPFEIAASIQETSDAVSGSSASDATGGDVRSVDLTTSKRRRRSFSKRKS